MWVVWVVFLRSHCTSILHGRVSFKVSQGFRGWESFVKKYFLVLCLVEIFIDLRENLLLP